MNVSCSIVVLGSLKVDDHRLGSVMSLGVSLLHLVLSSEALDELEDGLVVLGLLALLADQLGSESSDDD